MDTMELAMIVLFTGIIVVFTVLIILNLIIKGYGGIFSLFKREQSSKKGFKNHIQDVKPIKNEISSDVVAAISAAVYFLYSSENNTCRIVKINKSKIKDLSWKKIGAIENSTPFSCLRQI